MNEALREALEAGRQRDSLLQQQSGALLETGQFLTQALRLGRTVYLLGEGVCAAVTEHLANEFLRSGNGQTIPAVVALRHNSPGLPTAAPGESPDHILSRQVKALVGRGDVVLALCSTATSASIRAALGEVRAQGAVSIALVMGHNTLPDGLCDNVISYGLTNQHTGIECHMAVSHLLLRMVEQDLLATATGSGSVTATPPQTATVAPRRNRQAPPRVASTVTTAELANPQPDPNPGEVIRFRCVHCAEVLRVEARYATRRGQCPHCKSKFTVPDLATARETATGRHTTPEESDHPAIITTTSRHPTVVPTPDHQEQADERQPGNRRLETRFTVKDALVRFGMSEFPTPGNYHEPHPMENISCSGLAFVGACAQNPNLTAGRFLFLELDFPAYSKPVLAEARIERIVAATDKIMCRVACRFMRIDGAGEEKVRRLSENVCLRGIRRS